jgi:hypothetical protein
MFDPPYNVDYLTLKQSISVTRNLIFKILFILAVLVPAPVHWTDLLFATCHRHRWTVQILGFPHAAVPTALQIQDCIKGIINLNSLRPGLLLVLNPLKPNDPYMSRTAPLTSKRCILYICSTNVGTEYFKHAIYSAFFSLQNAVCFIMLTCLVSVLFTFYIQNVLKFKKIIYAPKG